MTRFFLMIALSLCALSAQARCPFEGLSLSHLEESSDYEFKKIGTVPFPQALVTSQNTLLGDLPEKECKEAFIADQVKIKSSGKIYTAFYSNEDSCDGGNSYGVMVEGTQPDPKKAVATIEDSDLWCL